MSKMQRNKGARIERELVAQLKSEGWQAMRVPLSGATTYAKGDVDVWDETGFRFNIEVKARKDGFKQLYKLFGTDRKAILFDKVAVSTNVAACFDASLPGAPPPKYFTTLKKLRGSSYILAVKANNKPFLFIGWWD